MKNTKGRKSKKPAKEYRRTTIVLDEATHAIGVRLAKDDRRSFSGLLAHLIDAKAKEAAA